MSVTKRIGGRALDELREISIEVDYTKWAEGSVLCCFGDTKVICTATIEERIPPWLKEKSPVQGWVTAEYSMLPRSTDRRMRREATAGKVGGRTHEISRLIGRAIRAGVDMRKLGPRMVSLDCDVIQADGGTRTASISGSFVALQLCINYMLDKKIIKNNPISENIAAISCGIVNGEPLLDLDYEEDQKADVDANFVITESGKLVEIQMTSEKQLCSEESFDTMFSSLAEILPASWLSE